ncbi:Ubiquitin carboxyl-terminal hydrolase 14 [Lamellibrachia satsuma]|nr:Ubiquitin carboxyl-terminal hydrolase 14 [Lamellibrachia satsuma]
MPVFKVHVKWGKEKFKDIECNTGEPPELFKAQLFALSGVQPDRQKVMVKGNVIKDDAWGNVKLRDGMTLLMMGSVDELPAEPSEKPMFMEDMTEQELASAMEMPAGLTNLGNTCYMNATLQCLKSVPELKDALQRYEGSLAGGVQMMPDQSITCAIRDLYGMMDKTASSIPPIIMLNVLHLAFPQFAEKNDNGEFSQQDANECWNELVRCLQRQLPMSSDDTAEAGQGAVGLRKSFIDRYFAGEFAITMKCVESDDEPVTKNTETFYQLSCFIQKEVKYLHTGLQSRLQEHITKHSPVLSRDAQYLRTCKIKRLPAYLTIQMVRFFYKEKEGVNAKILKDIKFPLSLDIFDLCSEETQKKLIPMRDRFKQDEDAKAELKSKIRAPAGKKGEEEEEEEIKMIKEPYSFPDDIGSNNSGYYELQAVLTHKGRSSTSGHYVGWVKKKGNEWLMFDDDNVSAVTAEDVQKLSGGRYV